MKKAIFFLIITLIFCNVFFLDTYKEIMGDFGDNFEYLGFMHMAKENILAYKHPFADNNTLRYPSGFNFSFGFDGVFAVIVGALLSIFLDPVLSYNITVVLILFFNIILSYYFFKKIANLYADNNNIELKSFCCALIFGASPYVFARLNSHLNLAFIAGFPALMYFIALSYKKLVQKDYIFKEKDLNIFWISILLILFGSLQYLITLIITAPFFIYITIRNKLFGQIITALRINAKNIIKGCIYFLAIFIFFYSGYLKGAIIKNISPPIESQKYFAPDILDFIVPNPYLGNIWSYFSPSYKSIEKIYTIGIIEILLFIYIFFSGLPKRTKLLSAVIYSFYIIMAFNLVKIPYFPEPGRLIILVSLYLCYIILTKPVFLVDKKFLYFIFFLLFTQRLFFEIQNTKVSGAEIFKENIMPLSGESVLNIPLAELNAYRSSLPIFYHKKIFDGYFHYIAFNNKSYETLSQKYANHLICASQRSNLVFPDEDRESFYNWLKDNEVSSVVVFKEDTHGKFYFEECTNVRNFWYFVNPLSYVLKYSSDGVNKNTFEFFSYNPNNLARFYFEKSGKLLISKIFIAPAVLNDFYIKLPNNEVIYPNWEKNEDGFVAEFDPPIEITAFAGDSVYIASPQKSYDNRYVFVYYSFEVDRNRPDQIKPRYELLYNDKSFEIYKVN